MYMRDGWPMYSWYDWVALWLLGTATTLAWRSGLGKHIVPKIFAIRERRYPTATT